MQRCPTCGTEYSADESSCPGCRDGDDRQTCTACATEYSGGDACPACGTLAAPVVCEEHPDREAVGRCVVCSRAVCSRCRRGGRAYLCAEHRSVPVIEGWAQVYSTSNELEARLVVENLRSEGLDAQLFSQRDQMFTVEIGELSIVRVLAPVWDYAAALSVIRQHMDTEGEVAFACPACGEAYDPGTHACASCGAALA